MLYLGGKSRIGRLQHQIDNILVADRAGRAHMTDQVQADAPIVS